MKRKRFEKALMGVGVSRNEAKRITRKIIAHKRRADQIHVRDREERVTDEA